LISGRNNNKEKAFPLHSTAAKDDKQKQKEKEKDVVEDQEEEKRFLPLRR
jgi:hypothetical protein